MIDVKRQGKMGKKNLGWGVNGPAAQNPATPGGPQRWAPRVTRQAVATASVAPLRIRAKARRVASGVSRY